jgi:signal peptidase II
VKNPTGSGANAPVDAAAGPRERTGGLGDGKLAMFLIITGTVVILDVATKLIVQSVFELGDHHDVIGGVVRFTYIENPGAAFGIRLGEYSRVIFLLLSLVALVALSGMYWFTPARERIRLVAIALICGGALGNLIDRIRSPRGVVDFLDVGIGALRWPVFNVADIAVTLGAIVLALSLWQEEKRVGAPK